MNADLAYITHGALPGVVSLASLALTLYFVGSRVMGGSGSSSSDLEPNGDNTSKAAKTARPRKVNRQDSPAAAVRDPGPDEALPALAVPQRQKAAADISQRMRLNPQHRKLLAPIQDQLAQVRERLNANGGIPGQHGQLCHRLQDLETQIAELVETWDRIPDTLRRTPHQRLNPAGPTPAEQCTETLQLLARGASDLHTDTFASDLRTLDVQHRYATDKFRQSILDADQATD